MTVEVEHNPTEHRYEVFADGELAGFASYREQDNNILFVHTAVEPAYRGRGLAHQLVDEALADVREQGKRPVGVCPFVAGVIDRGAKLAS